MILRRTNSKTNPILSLAQNVKTGEDKEVKQKLLLKFEFDHYLIYILLLIMIICSILCDKPKTMAQLDLYHRPIRYNRSPAEVQDKILDGADDESTVDLDVPERNHRELNKTDPISVITPAFDDPADGGLMIGKGPTRVMFDEEDYDDDEDDLSEDFYSENPLGSSPDDPDFGRDIPIKESDFKDVYQTLTDKRPIKKKIYNDTDKINEPSALSSRRRRIGNGNIAMPMAANGLLNCAVVLGRGQCITYPMVELAFREARRILRFQTPDGLNSMEPSEHAIHKVGELNEWATRILASRFQLSWEEISFELEQIDVSRTTAWQTCPALFRSPPNCLALSRYRTHTGQCNNLMGPHLGANSMPFMRILPAQYDDAIGLPRTLSSLSRVPLPPARLLAINLHPDVGNPSQDHSALFVSWGQLLNHDMAMASGARDATGHGSPCCPNRRRSNRICMPIEILANDPLYGPYGIRCHEFKRTLIGLRPGCTLGPRSQLNTITSYLDASFVYGSSRSMNSYLRTERRGLLRTWNYFGGRLKPLLPPQDENPDEECVNRRGRYCFLSGDGRTNQQIQLAALHTVHTRQHNRLALALGQINPHWTSDRIYHEARHIHIAIVQHIILTEYLSALLGPDLCAVYNLTEAPDGEYWDHYDPTVSVGISQAFAAAAFRQGHSTVPGEVYRFNNQHVLTRVHRLRQFFRQPFALYEPGAMDEFLLGMVDAPSQSVDPFVTSDLSGHLLQMPKEPIGLDLVAINIQRGRDQGVAGYNAFRDWCGLGRAGSSEELKGSMSNRSAELMSLLYETPDDIDLFTGGISEYPADGAQVGPTFACIIGRQFEALRRGDRFWFETSMGPQAFSPAQLASIKQVSLARVICANSDNIVTIQQMALQQAHPVLNPRQLCASLPDLDISLWFEPPVTGPQPQPIWPG